MCFSISVGSNSPLNSVIVFGCFSADDKRAKQPPVYKGQVGCAPEPGEGFSHRRPTSDCFVFFFSIIIISPDCSTSCNFRGSVFFSSEGNNHNDPLVVLSGRVPLPSPPLAQKRERKKEKNAYKSCTCKFRFSRSPANPSQPAGKTRSPPTLSQWLRLSFDIDRNMTHNVPWNWPLSSPVALTHDGPSRAIVTV